MSPRRIYYYCMAAFRTNMAAAHERGRRELDLRPDRIINALPRLRIDSRRLFFIIILFIFKFIYTHTCIYIYVYI